MRTLWTAAFLVAAALASAPAPALADTPSLTQERQNSSQDNDLLWNILGALGIFGLFGLQRPSDNDGYTNDPI